MSEQALNASPSGASLNTASAATGTFPVISGGKSDPTNGKDAPEVRAVEESKNRKPDLGRLAEKLNTASRAIGRDLRFQVDLDRGNAVLQVIDSETGEIIRQIPHEQAAQTYDSGSSTGIRLLDALV